MGYTDLSKPKRTNGADNVKIDNPTSTFGELLTVTLEPVAQGDFVHGINSQIFTTSSFAGGTVTNTSGMASLSSGTDAQGSATVQLRRRLEYRPGQGSLMKATALFSSPDAGNAQFIGAGTAECGYFIGYFGSNFGILHSETGAREIRKLTITTGEDDDTDVTITLDGDSIVVPVTGGNEPEQTAYQISLADYSQVGTGGWLADAQSGSVYFISARSAATFTGTYSVAGSSIVGSFTQERAGVAQTNTFIAQSSFNVDTLDGSGPSQMTLDPLKGNVYQIGYQYLGFGNVSFGVEDPETGFNAMCHMIKNANSRTTPVLKDPNLAVLATSANIGGTTNVTLKSASMAGFTEGKVFKLDPKFAKSFTFTTINESEYVPLAILKANRVFDSRSSFGEFDILRINGSNETNNKTLTVGLFLNVEIEGMVDFQYVDVAESIVSYATLAPATNTIKNIGSLTPFYEIVVGAASGVVEDLDPLKFIFGPGVSLTIAIKTTAAIDGQVGISWFEQQ